MTSIEFLELSDLLEIHSDQVFHYGGTVELRDAGLLESAIEQAKASRGIDSWAERRANLPHDSDQAPSETENTSAKAAANDGKRLQAAERRVSTLEQHNAALVAENFELRRQLKDLKRQLGRQDMMIDTGRRVPLPADFNDA